MIYQVPLIPEDYLRVVKQIDALRQQLRYAISDGRRRWTGLLRRSTFALAIQGSNSIEGYAVDQADAVAAVDGEQPLSAADETWLAITGYRQAMSYVLQLADDPHYVHNVGTLRSLHYMMVQHEVSKNPGKWRPGAVWVRSEPSGETVYEGPDVQLVPGLMEELAGSLNATNTLPVVVRAALAHLNLVMIHPFSDGNGRMGRALQTMVLAREGIIDPHFSSIEEYLGKNTLQYYAVLAEVGQGAWHPENDPLPWVKFCLRAHFQQAQTLLTRTTEIALLWSELEKVVKGIRMNERALYALADAAMGYTVRNSSYRKHAEVSEQVASRELKQLVDFGLLRAMGEKRGRYYEAGDELKVIRQSTRRSSAITDPFEGPERS